MRPIPPAIRRQLDVDSKTARCARIDDGGCAGRLTIEHAYGRVNQQRWQLVFLCWNHHLGPLLDKSKNRWLALKQATDEELRQSKLYESLKQDLKYLTNKYGIPRV